MKKLIINTDGGSRGNPGPAGIGVVFSNADGQILAEYKEYIGEATNNIAEYRALILALEKAKSFSVKDGSASGWDEIECRLDSELVVKQIRGEYKVKDEKLMPLFGQVHELSFFKPIKFVHVRREFNKEADALANLALDEAASKKNDDKH
jgi:ribonuclease HI